LDIFLFFCKFNLAEFVWGIELGNQFKFLKIFFAACLFFFSQTAVTQSLTDGQLLLERLQTANCDILFPSEYAELAKQLTSAVEVTPASDFKEYHSWLQRSEQVSKNLADIIDLRNRALRHGADKINSTFFQQAESALKQAAKAESDQRNTRSAQKAYDLYKKADIEAIREYLVNDAKIIIYESEQLQAETLSPQQYHKTKRLLKELEALLEKKNVPYLQLSEKATELVGNTQQLSFLVKNIQPIVQSNEKLEAFMTDLHQQLKKLAEQLNTSLDPNDTFAEHLQTLREQAKFVEEKIALLQKQNEQLADENRLLKHNLIVQMTNSASDNLLQDKIERIVNLTPAVISLKNGYLTLNMDSINFIPQTYQLTPESQKLLEKLSGVLAEFSHSPVIVRYTLSSKLVTPQLQQLATWRAEAICDYLAKIDTFANRNFQPFGMVYKNYHPTQTDGVEILLDLQHLINLPTTQTINVE
jgi:uncharacterized protein YukE